jgi:hypothetical protein
VDAYECTQTLADISCATDMLARHSSSIMLYPNPSEGIVHLRDVHIYSELRIINILGEELESYLLNGLTNLRLNLRHYPPGQYIIMLSGQSSVFARLVKL